MRGVEKQSATWDEVPKDKAFLLFRNVNINGGGLAVLPKCTF